MAPFHSVVRTHMTLCLVFVALIVAGQASAQLVNGSFESGPNPGGFARLGDGDTQIDGWIVGGSIDYIGSVWVAAVGARSIDLGGGFGEAGSISQNLSTIPGTTYQVTFAMAGNLVGAPVVKTMIVSAASTSQQFTFDTTGQSLADMGWTEETFTFTATSATTTLTFAGADPNFGAAVDDIRIEETNAVPGMGLIGASLLMVIAAGIGRSALRRRESGSAAVE